MKRDLIIHRSERGKHGDPGVVVTHLVEDVVLAPRMSSESDERGQQVIVGYTAFPPTGADILPGDLAEFDGNKYDVDGELADWESPFDGWQPGGQVALTRSS